MTCQERQRQVVLAVYDELPDPDKSGLEGHLAECEPCRAYRDEEIRLYRMMADDAETVQIPASLLVECRSDLGNSLDRAEERASWWRSPFLLPAFLRYRLLESAALVSVGLAFGVYVTKTVSIVPPAAPVLVQQQSGQQMPDGDVTNLRVISSDPATGQVELGGDVSHPLRLNGTLADESVRRLLLGALKSEDNPGSRLHAVELLSRSPQDQAAKQALIEAMVQDPNAGVRLSALQGLKAFAAETDVREALMYALKNDGNSGVRVEAIEALTRYSTDSAVARIIREVTKEDENAYVRMKSLQFVGSPK